MDPCCICMDELDLTKNFIATECGHAFHASCLMRNVAHNGFGCPYCRTIMAEEIDDHDEETINDSDSELSEEEEDDDYTLRGFRFFMNNITGIEHDEEDENAEDDDEDAEEQSVEQAEQVRIQLPTYTEVTAELTRQNIGMEDVVKAILFELHEEYYGQDRVYEDYMNKSNEVYEKIRRVIRNRMPRTLATNQT